QACREAGSARLTGYQATGAEGGTRTHTGVSPADFESAASTGSATSARAGSITGGGCPAGGISGGAVEPELGAGALEPLALHRHEHAALLHRALVDVQGDGDAVGAGVADGVVFVRRDQAARAAGAGAHAARGAEAATLAVTLQ